MSESMQLELATPPASIIEVAMKLPPRDLVKVADEIKTVVTRTPGLARKCIYCRPVGKKDGRQTFAIGPSVRLTEIAQNSFGRIWLNGDVIETDRTIVVKTMAFDLMTLNIVFDTTAKSVSKANGQRYSQSQIEVVKAAAQSISRRNAILQLTRAQLEAIMADVKAQIIRDVCGDQKGATVGKAWTKLAEDAKGIGVSEESMKSAVANEKTPADKIVMMVGILNAISDGLVSAQDVFGTGAGGSTKPAGVRMPTPKGSGKDENVGFDEDGQIKEDFVSVAKTMAKEVGLNEEGLGKALFDNFEIGAIEDVPDDKQGEVLDFLGSLKEGHGA